MSNHKRVENKGEEISQKVKQQQKRWKIEKILGVGGPDKRGCTAAPPWAS